MTADSNHVFDGIFSGHDLGQEERIALQLEIAFANHKFVLVTLSTCYVINLIAKARISNSSCTGSATAAVFYM